MAQVKQYTLAIEFAMPEDAVFPTELLEAMNDPDALCAAIIQLTGSEDVADDVLRVSGAVYGPDPACI